MENIVLNRKCVLTPVKGCDWASEMVLNPAIIKDPKTGRIHMIVRVSGPCPQKKLDGKPMPFPIFMAYGWSDDGGETFEFDFEKPALSPGLEYEREKLLIKDGRGELTPAYNNGCIEDPRLFFIEGECYLTLACRMFPAGPYWEYDDPKQCMPDWALEGEPPFDIGNNNTVSVLYRVDLDALSRKDYDKAFTYITNLTDPARGQDRDVIIMPERMMIDGELQYVMIHRPVTPNMYEEFDETRPSIVMSAAKDFYSFAKGATKRRLIYAPKEDWQKERVGASTQLVDISEGEWLLPYHGKRDDVMGYSQSFMILKAVEGDFPIITHLCPDRWIVNEADFERPAKFGIPCVFFTGAIKEGNKLIISYGAADEVVGVMTVDYDKLLRNLYKMPYNREDA